MSVSMQALKGSTRSKTVYLGAAVVALAYLGGDSDALEPLVSQAHMETFVRIASYLVGLGVVVVRFFTDESLEEKAKEE